MSVTSEDQEADDIVHFPSDPDSRSRSDVNLNNHNHNHDQASSPSHSHSSEPQSHHCSQSEDDGHDDGNEQDEQDNYSSSSSDYDDDEGDLERGQYHPPASFSQHAFAPPFYGRPPTPLPPSPSLTSLLRPSRPTTPDASDDEGHSTTGGGTGENGTRPHSTRRAHSGSDPVPRASPKVPTYEYYGFVLYLFSGCAFGIYLLWSYLPSPFLHALGIYYYPNRWWSVAIPSFLVMVLVYIYVALALYNTEYLTLGLGSVETVVDGAANVAVVDGKGRIRRGKHAGYLEKDKGGKKEKGKGKGGKERERERERERDIARERRKAHSPPPQRRREVLLPNGSLNWREVWNEGTDAVMDVPLGGVCEVLYGEGRDGGYLSEDSLDEEEIITRL
ncbi:PIG-P domain containing protein [Naviculisporaceae sp. PSN 640]